MLAYGVGELGVEVDAVLGLKDLAHTLSRPVRASGRSRTGVSSAYTYTVAAS
ncbi:hypothetical protein [Streptomyces sp. BF23-19]|uniref:hypothetical protein n=1 Tax=unclassified Streptomyces TaxID=2593676 RepID=UPI0034E398CE